MSTFKALLSCLSLSKTLDLLLFCKRQVVVDAEILNFAPHKSEENLSRDATNKKTPFTFICKFLLLTSTDGSPSICFPNKDFPVFDIAVMASRSTSCDWIIKDTNQKNMRISFYLFHRMNRLVWLPLSILSKVTISGQAGQLHFLKCGKCLY